MVLVTWLRYNSGKSACEDPRRGRHMWTSDSCARSTRPRGTLARGSATTPAWPPTCCVLWPLTHHCGGVSHDITRRGGERIIQVVMNFEENLVCGLKREFSLKNGRKPFSYNFFKTDCFKKPFPRSINDPRNLHMSPNI